jgi:hypothetical protein
MTKSLKPSLYAQTAPDRNCRSLFQPTVNFKIRGIAAVSELRRCLAEQWATKKNAATHPLLGRERLGSGFDLHERAHLL